MIIHNPIVSGSLRFPSDENGNLITLQVVNGTLETLTLNSSGVNQNIQPAVNYSGSFTGSFIGDGSGLTGLTSANNNTITLTAGAGLDGGGSITLNQSSDETITFTVSDGVISGSSQVDHDATTNFVAGEHFLQSAITTVGTVTTGNVQAILPSGTISGSSQVSLETLTGGSGIQSGSITNADLAGSIANSKLSNSSITISGTSVSLGGSITDETLFGGVGVVTGSAQISHDSTTGFVANEHIDHSSVSITAGTGLNGGGTIASTRTLNVDSDYKNDSLNAFTASNANTSLNAATSSYLTSVDISSDTNLAVSDTSEVNMILSGDTLSAELIGGVVSGSDQVASTFAQTILDDTSAGAVRTTIGVDAAGTDNSTDVTLAGSYDYITISGQTITRGQITNDDLAGSIANSKLSNSAITISGTSVSLGGSITDETLFGGVGVVSGSAQIADVTLTTAAQPNITSLGTLTTLTVDDVTINGSTISDAGDLTLDIGGDLNIDVDGTDIVLKDGGTAFGRFKRDSSDFIIKSEANNEDIIFRGQDGGATIDALLLDMSNAGEATFNNVVNATKVNTGQGDNELYAMNQDVQTTDNVQFANLTLSGDLTVNGETSYISSSVVQIGDNILELNGSAGANGGIYVRDAVGTTNSGSLLWDTSNDYWKAGAKGSELKLLREGGDDVISGSAQVSIGSTTGTLAVNKGGTGATTAAGARSNLGVDAAGTDNSTDVTLAGTPNYITISGQTITRNTIDIGDDTNLAVSDTDEVNMILSGDTLSAELIGGVVSGSGQVDHDSTSGFVANEHINHGSVSITAGTGLNGGGTIASTRTLNVDSDYKNDSLNTFTSSFSSFGLSLIDDANASTARSTLGVDAAGTDNSTDVSLAGSYDYITISGQTITRGQIDLTTDVTGVLPSANLDSDTAHLSGTQTFSGTKTFTNETTHNGGIKLGNDDKIRWTSDDVYIAGTTSGDNIDFVVAAGSRFNISQTDIDMKIPVNVDDTTQSTSKTTGCMIIDGGVGIAKTLNVGEDVVAFASSDERYKDNVTPIENPNDKIKQIGGYTFDWNDKHEIFKGQHDVGVIAQEIEKVLPEIVETRDNGFKAVKYEKIVALLIESNKELIKRIEELENKIS